MDVLHERLARRIRVIAEARKLPLSHLADRAGVVRSHMWRVLAGRASPTVAWLGKIAAVLDVEAADLISRRKPTLRVKRRR